MNPVVPPPARPARRLDPDLFGHLDPVAGLRRWHEDWLPVPFEGSWLAMAA